MKKVFILIVLLSTSFVLLAQNRKNYIKPINQDGFVVDSIIGIKGGYVSYLLAGTEFDIDKSQVSYIEHSLLGRIVINDESKIKASRLIIPEPEFNGEAFLCNFNDTSYVKLEKAIGQVKITDQLMGPEKKLYVKPSMSNVRVHTGKIFIIIKVPDNTDEPTSFIMASKFSANSKSRKLSLARQNELTGSITYGGRKDQDIYFEAERYGNSSFLLTLVIEEAGEYCIAISNPNIVDNRLTVSCFGVDE
jgi:hypothetical protein